MPRRRSRLPAAAIVAMVTIASAAQASFIVTQNPASTEPVPLSTATRILVSLRNPMSSSQTLTMIGRAPLGNANCPASVQISTADFVAIPYALPAYSQIQFVISSNGFSAGDPMPATCVWEVMSSDLGIQQFTTVFDIVPTSTVTWDVQPKLNDFGSQSVTNASETQKILINNYLASASTFVDMVINDPSGSIRFVSDCPGLQSCTGPFTVIGKTARLVEVACDPTSALLINATFTIYSASAPLGTTSLNCTGTSSGGGGIDIVPLSVDLMGDQGLAQVAAVMITSNPQPNQVVYAEITGTDASAFTMTAGSCTGQICSFSPGLPTDTSLSITCTPNGSTRTAQLLVRGPANDTDTATLSCTTTGGGASQWVTPASYDAMTVAVGGMAGPFPVTITNTSATTTLTTMAFLSDGINWSVDNCTASCTIAPMTSSIVNVSFHPMTAGPHNAVLTVNGTGGMGTVSLTGNGDTTQRLDVEIPASFQLAFGALARNQAVTNMVTLRATGPSGYMVTLTDPGGVYTLSQQTLTMAPNGTAMFDVTCQSPTPSGPNAATITISATPTPTAQNSMTIGLSCTIQDTDVQVTPTTFPFDEVRVGTAERRIPFTIHNAGGDVMISFVRVAPPRPGLSVTSIMAQPLSSGSDLTGDVILSSAQEVDLAGAFLEIGVSGEPTRQLPITGKIVRAKASVTPARLDLGTVCVGTQIGGQITMSNSGTATLRVERPVMDQTSFTASATPPDVYPLDLAAGADATITISPSTSAMGMVSNALMWSVDAPGSPFRVPVSMTYVTTGGAVSPSLVAFPPLDVFGTSSDRKVTLQNCSDIELPLTIEGVVATAGDASAWTVAPRTLQRALAPKEIVEVIVRFTPKTPGEHHARLVIEIGGEDRSILLEGFADGERRDGISFYACSCSGPGAPSLGLPIVIAIALILRRRRR